MWASMAMALRELNVAGEKLSILANTLVSDRQLFPFT
jgi:hypothetical protein